MLRLRNCEMFGRSSPLFFSCSAAVNLQEEKKIWVFYYIYLYSSSLGERERAPNYLDGHRATLSDGNGCMTINFPGKKYILLLVFVSFFSSFPRGNLSDPPPTLFYFSYG